MKEWREKKTGIPFNFYIFNFGDFCREKTPGQGANSLTLFS